jgi:hypothetical protein
MLNKIVLRKKNITIIINKESLPKNKFNSTYKFTNY